MSAIQASTPQADSVAGQREYAERVRDAYRQFVGHTFYSHMLKAMRQTVGEPAYFHGGRAEQIFQSQLDQVLADHMTEANAEQLADPIFERQFPGLAETLRTTDSRPSAESYADLARLRRP